MKILVLGAKGFVGKNLCRPTLLVIGVVGVEAHVALAHKVFVGVDVPARPLGVATEVAARRARHQRHLRLVLILALLRHRTNAPPLSAFPFPRRMSGNRAYNAPRSTHGLYSPPDCGCCRYRLLGFESRPCALLRAYIGDGRASTGVL